MGRDFIGPQNDWMLPAVCLCNSCGLFNSKWDNIYMFDGVKVSQNLKAALWNHIFLLNEEIDMSSFPIKRKVGRFLSPQYVIEMSVFAIYWR